MPSKSQSVLSHWTVKDAVGAWLGSTVRSTIDQVVAVALALSAVATSPPYCPVGTAAPESASELQMRPVPVLQSACRPVACDGSVKPVVVLVLSAQ